MKNKQRILMKTVSVFNQIKLVLDKFNKKKSIKSFPCKENVRDLEMKFGESPKI